jgi:hypothetical protein
VAAVTREALAARGERERTGRRRHLQAGDAPAHPAVGGRDDAEVDAVRRIGEREPPVLVEERHAVVKRRRLRVHEGEVPARAAVVRDVDAEVGRVVPDGHRHRVVGAEGLDVAELEAGRAGRAHVQPGCASICGPEDDAGGRGVPARPGSRGANRGKAAKVSGRSSRRVLPAVPRWAGGGERDAHDAGESCKQQDPLQHVATLTRVRGRVKPPRSLTASIRARARRGSGCRRLRAAGSPASARGIPRVRSRGRRRA